MNFSWDYVSKEGREQSPLLIDKLPGTDMEITCKSIMVSEILQNIEKNVNLKRFYQRFSNRLQLATFI